MVCPHGCSSPTWCIDCQVAEIDDEAANFKKVAGATTLKIARAGYINTAGGFKEFVPTETMKYPTDCRSCGKVVEIGQELIASRESGWVCATCFVHKLGGKIRYVEG